MCFLWDNRLLFTFNIFHSILHRHSTGFAASFVLLHVFFLKPLQKRSTKRVSHPFLWCFNIWYNRTYLIKCSIELQFTFSILVFCCTFSSRSHTLLASFFRHQALSDDNLHILILVMSRRIKYLCIIFF